MTHALHAYNALLTADEKGPAKAPKPTERNLEQAAWTMTHAVRSIPPDDWMLRPKLRGLPKELGRRIIPTKDKPLTLKRPLARIALTIEIDAMKELPTAELEAHPAAAVFPGSVSGDAPRVTRSFTVDLSVPGRHGTGLYAPAGRVVTIKTQPDHTARGLQVRVGCHSDTLWHHKSWKRCPEICRSVEITAPLTQAANPFGGLLYIDVPRGLGPGTARLTMCDAVEAPRFVLGKTTREAWQKKIRCLPGPWAELETGKVVLTVPSEAVRALDDPEKLMLFWNSVSDACADLAGQPRERERPERYVADVQISAGYMHVGYPIMTHLDIVDAMLDKTCLIENGHGGVWGLFHELGHNHQSSDWTFNGTGEVTVNLFTLYVFETVCGLATEGHGSFTKVAQEKAIREHLAGGADFETWKSRPFLALIMYVQLREAFGWETFKKVFALYRDLPGAARPKNDAEKRDQWLVHFSRTTRRNLGPFFEAWGVPVSPNAKASIEGLPVWMPPGFPPR